MFVWTTGRANYSFIQHNPTQPNTAYYSSRSGGSLFPPTLTWNVLLYFKATDKVLLAVNCYRSLSAPPLGLALFAELAKIMLPRQNIHPSFLSRNANSVRRVFSVSRALAICTSPFSCRTSRRVTFTCKWDIWLRRGRNGARGENPRVCACTRLALFLNHMQDFLCSFVLWKST